MVLNWDRCDIYHAGHRTTTDTEADSQIHVSSSPPSSYHELHHYLHFCRHVATICKTAILTLSQQCETSSGSWRLNNYWANTLGTVILRYQNIKTPSRNIHLQSGWDTALSSPVFLLLGCCPMAAAFSVSSGRSRRVRLSAEEGRMTGSWEVSVCLRHRLLKLRVWI